MYAPQQKRARAERQKGDNESNLNTLRTATKRWRITLFSHDTPTWRSTETVETKLEINIDLRSRWREVNTWTNCCRNESDIPNHANSRLRLWLKWHVRNVTTLIHIKGVHCRISSAIIQTFCLLWCAEGLFCVFRIFINAGGILFQVTEYRESQSFHF